MSGQFVDLPPHFGDRLKELRAAMNWRQEDLVKATAEADRKLQLTRYREGVKPDTISNLERDKNTKCRGTTVRLVAEAFGMTMEELIPPVAMPNNTSIYLTDQPLATQTTLFRKEAKQLRTYLENQVDRAIVVEGPAGIGKSRVCSSIGQLEGISIFWFVGSSLEELELSLSQVDQRDQPHVIILDESYQKPSRPADIFEQLLTSDAWLDQFESEFHRYVFSLRRETYQQLSQQGLLAQMPVVSLENSPDQLDRFAALNLNRPLTDDERKWILQTSQNIDDRLELNSFLLDQVLFPAIKDGQASQSLSRSALQTIYQYQIAGRSQREVRQLQAIDLASQLAYCATWWFVGAIIESDKNKEATSDRITNLNKLKTQLARLAPVQMDDFPLYERRFSAPTVTRIRFKHDLLQQALQDQSGTSPKSRASIHQAFIRLVETQIQTATDLTEAIAAYLTLITEQKEGLEPIAKALATQIERFLEGKSAELSADEKRVLAEELLSLIWSFVNDRVATDFDQLRPSFVKAIDALASPLVQALEPEDANPQMRHDGAFDGALIPFGHFLYKLAVLTDEVIFHPFWAMRQSKLPFCQAVSQQLADELQSSEPEQVVSLDRAFPKAHFYLWAEQFGTAANLLRQSCRQAIDAKSNPPEEIWRSLILAVGADLEDGNPERAKEGLLLAEQLANRHQRPALAEWYRLAQSQLSQAESGQQLMTSLAELETKTQPMVSLVCGGYDLPTANLILDQLSPDSDGQICCFGSIQDLTETTADRIIVLGGASWPSIWQLVGPYLSSEAYGEMARAQKRPPNYAGREQAFTLPNQRKVIWLGGGWEQKTAEVVKNWIQQRCFDKFLED